MIVISPQIAKRLPPTSPVRVDHTPGERRDRRVRDDARGPRPGSDVAPRAFAPGLARPLLGLLAALAMLIRGFFRPRKKIGWSKEKA